jgi:hypothetical protein
MARHEHFDLTEDEQEEIAALHRSGESALSIAQHMGISAASVADYIEYYDLRQFKKVVDRASGAAFVLGIGLLIFAGLPLPFWPGILFVLGISALIRAFARYHRSGNAQSAIWLFGLGLMFMPGVDFSFTGILVLIGFSIIAGILFKGRFDDIEEDEEDEKDEEDDDDDDEEESGDGWHEARRQIGREIKRELRRELSGETQGAKRKNEELVREGEKPKRAHSPGRLRLSDDGELIEAVDIDVDTVDQEERSASDQ